MSESDREVCAQIKNPAGAVVPSPGSARVEGTLYVVACSALKSPKLVAGPCPARDAYAGQMFIAALRRLEQAKAQWCVLSGKYGILWPSTVIEFYDQKITPLAEGEAWDDCFGLLTNRQYATMRTAKRVVVIGSALYARVAEQILERPVEAPLAGLPIGRMKQRLGSLPLHDFPVAATGSEVAK